MRLLAACNKTHAVFSVSHYDCRGTDDGLMADGGQPGCQNYAGYTRASHEMRWIELPDVTFAQLVQDYNEGGANRKYGIHPLSEVRFLTDEEKPDTQSFEWHVENACWGTRGKDGDQPLKMVLLRDAETDHLQAILATQRLSQETIKIISHILSTRK